MKIKKKKSSGGNQVAILLSGCGYFDGTEVTEAVSGMLSFSQRGIALNYFTVDGNIEEVYDHIAKKLERNEIRNVSSESTRISRVTVQKLNRLKASAFDYLFIPGGNGIGRTFSNYFEDGINFKINTEIEKVLIDFHKERKIIVMSGLASILAARLWGKKYGGAGCKITLGTDPQIFENAISLGATHVQKSSGEAVPDEDNMLISTPGFLNSNATPYQVYCGIERFFAEIPNLSKKSSVKSDGSGVDLLKNWRNFLTDEELVEIDKKEKEKAETANRKK